MFVVVFWGAGKVSSSVCVCVFLSVVCLADVCLLSHLLLFAGGGPGRASSWRTPLVISCRVALPSVLAGVGGASDDAVLCHVMECGIVQCSIA